MLLSLDLECESYVDDPYLDLAMTTPYHVHKAEFVPDVRICVCFFPVSVTMAMHMSYCVFPNPTARV